MTEPDRDLDGSNVLVTGGAGAIGSNLVGRLCACGVESVVVLDDLSSGHRWLLPDDDRITLVEGSVLDEEKLKRVFKHDPDYVFHLAAHFANQNSVDHPETDLQVNGMGTLKTMEYAQLTEPERFVYVSSGCGVYGEDSTVPYREDDVSLRLGTPYQVTKLLGELVGNYFEGVADLPVTSARLFNSFGPGEVPGRYRNVIPNFFYWASQGRPLPITGDGSEVRDWTYVGDIVDGLLRMATVDGAVGESFNLATGSGTEVIEMARMVNERVGNEGNLEFLDRRDWDDEREIVGSPEKARRILGYEPETSFEAGIDAVHDWFETNEERIESVVSPEFADHSPV